VNHIVNITLRRLSKEKIYTFVNIMGLSIGMASAMLIFLFLRHETSYDSYHNKHPQIYRVATDLKILDHNQLYAVSSAAIAPALYNEFEEITSFVRLFYLHYFFRDIIYQYEHQRFYEKEVFAADSTFFDFFTCKFIEGSANKALSQPFSLVLTQSMAEKIFGKGKNALGEKIMIRNVGDFTVTAVVENPPINTHFQYQGLISISSLDQMSAMFLNAFGPGITWQDFEQSFGSTVVWSYIMTNDDFNPEKFYSFLWPVFHQKYIQPLTRDHQIDIDPILQNITAIHLESKLLYEIGSEIISMRIMDHALINTFFFIALFLMLVAVINYTNIAISHFNKRRKQMGMMKILGGESNKLFASFFAESFASALAALIVALVLLELLLPTINIFLHVNLTLNVFSNIHIFLTVFFVFLFTAVLSGLFPAIYFASTPPLKLLTSRFQTGKKSLFLKKVLIIIQLWISVFLITATIVIYQQLDYAQEMNPGYSAENIMVVELHDNESKMNVNLLADIFKKNQEVRAIAKSDFIFSMYPIKHTVLIETPTGNSVRSFNTVQISSEYLDMLNIKILHTDTLNNHSEGVIVNQAFIDSLGFDNPIGKTITTHYQFLGGKLRMARPIIAVTENFHYAYFNQPIEPLIMLPAGIKAHYLSILFEPVSHKKKEQIIEKTWSKFDPGNPLTYFSLQERIDNYFSNQKTLTAFFGYFAFLCIIISFLGVYGITSYNLEQKRIEIGIRKVIGAGIGDLFMIFFTDYLKLLFIAWCLALATGWYILHLWLKNFSFAINLSFWPFVAAMLLSGLTIVLAISIHMSQVIKLSPAPTLKTS
jgi:putative ABC transport system permease protein